MLTLHRSLLRHELWTVISAGWEEAEAGQGDFATYLMAGVGERKLKPYLLVKRPVGSEVQKIPPNAANALDPLFQ